MNKNMINAQRNKNDEFYTQYEDIKKEVDNYWEVLNGKVIYCNTDNYEKSNFVKYFIDKFKDIGIKKLISLDLDGSYFEYDGTKEERYKLESGDFRCKKSIDILKSADVVITNPPFSLFREYMKQLIEYNKDFLIIGNNNALAYKDIFPLIKNNKIWLGYNANKTMEFGLHKDYKKWGRIDDNGDKYGKVPAISWFTNLPIDKRYEDIPLSKYYYGNEEKYPKYDNYDAIEVSRVKNIPKDYEGVMGVPITFLVKYNPCQFKILGSHRWSKSQELLDVYKGDVEPPENDKKTTINGKETYGRIFIKHI